MKQAVISNPFPIQLMVRKFYRSAVQFLLLASCLASVVSSCQKKTEEPAPPKLEIGAGLTQRDVQIIQQKFTESAQAEKLIDKFGATTTLAWEPIWDKAFTVGPNVYLPMRFRANKLGALQDLYGAKRFLIYSATPKETAFWIATYHFDSMAEAQYLPDSPNFLTAFSGSCSLRLLGKAKEKLTLSHYKKGTLLRAAASKATGAKTNTQHCTTIYECQYSNECHFNSNVYTVYTTTVSENKCEEPTSEPCPDWGIMWNYVASYTHTECSDDPVSSDSQPLPEQGVYNIRNMSSGNVLTAQGASAAAGTSLTVEALKPFNASLPVTNDVKSQRWEVTYYNTYSVPYGTSSITYWFYTVRCILGNTLAEPQGGGITTNTPIVQTDPNNMASQKWQIEIEGNTPGVYIVNNSKTMNNPSGAPQLGLGDGAGVAQLANPRVQTSPYPNYSFYYNPSTLWYFDEI